MIQFSFQKFKIALNINIDHAAKVDNKCIKMNRWYKVSLDIIKSTSKLQNWEQQYSQLVNSDKKQYQ